MNRKREQMKKKEGYVRDIILIVICLLLILLGVVLAAALWKQQSRYEAEKKQWEQKEQKYEKQLKKLRKQQKEDQAAETAHPNARLLENLDDSNPGDVLEPYVLDMEDISRYFSAYEIVEGDPVYQRINGKSYCQNPDIGLDELTYFKMLHYNFDGEIQVGELIMNSALKEDVLEIFQELFEHQYQIQSMYLVDNYWTGDGITSDSASIDQNNTSAFNYRQSTASAELSNHAFGRAIDINPLQNPYIWYNEDGTPDEYYRDEKYIDRSLDDPHIIDHDDLCCRLFLERGFTWGGDWVNPIDYQHFEKRK